MFIHFCDGLTKMEVGIRKVFSVCSVVFYVFSWTGVLTTCPSSSDKTTMSFCSPATQTNRSFYIDTAAVPQDLPAECKCSVNISENAQHVLLTYSYQGASHPCTDDYYFMIANVSIGCNFSSINVRDFEELVLIKDSDAAIGQSCLLLYIDKDVPENETDASATVTCYESNLSIPSTSPSVNTSSTGITQPFVSQNDSSTQSTSPDGSETTTILSQETTEVDRFTNYLILIIVVAVCGVLIIIVMIVFIVICCRNRNTKATYSVKKTQASDKARLDSDSENAFYNIEYKKDLD